VRHELQPDERNATGTRTSHRDHHQVHHYPGGGGPLPAGGGRGVQCLREIQSLREQVQPPGRVAGQVYEECGGEVSVAPKSLPDKFQIY
jgi:hypothetical protein